MASSKKSARRANWLRRGQRLWPQAEWIDGDGPFAVLAYCRTLTIELHEDRESAEKAMMFIARAGCGGQCYADHELINLSGRSRKR